MQSKIILFTLNTYIHLKKLNKTNFGEFFKIKKKMYLTFTNIIYSIASLTLIVYLYYVY